MNHKRTRSLATFGLVAALALGSMPLSARADGIDELQQRVNDAYAQLMEYSYQVEAANNELFEVKQNLSETREAIEATKREVAEKQEELKKDQEALSERLNKSYKRDDASILSFILGSSDFSELFSNIFYANKYAERDREAIEAVRSAKRELEAKQTELAEQEARQEELVVKQESKTQAAKAKAQESQSYYTGLDSELQKQLADEAALKAAAEALAQEQADADKGGNSGNGAGGNDSNGIGDKGDTGNNSVGGGAGNESPSTPQPAPQPEPEPEPEQPSYGGNSGSSVSSAADFAEGKVGCDYVAGGSGPSSFDCSGLTSWAYAQAGVYIPHSSSAQYGMVAGAGHLVSDPGLLKRGDLVFYEHGWGIDHVAIYLGGGLVVHATNPSSGVLITGMYWGGGYVGGGSPV